MTKAPPHPLDGHEHVPADPGTVAATYEWCAACGRRPDMHTDEYRNFVADYRQRVGGAA